MICMIFSKICVVLVFILAEFSRLTTDATKVLSDGFTIQVQQTSQIEKTHRLSPCKMESPQDQLQGELDYESVHPSYLKRP